MRIKCNNPKCNHVWNYRGLSKFYTNCPKCMYKVQAKEMNVEEILDDIAEDNKRKEKLRAKFPRKS